MSSKLKRANASPDADPLRTDSDEDYRPPTAPNSMRNAGHSGPRGSSDDEIDAPPIPASWSTGAPTSAISGPPTKVPWTAPPLAYSDHGAPISKNGAASLKDTKLTIPEGREYSSSPNRDHTGVSKREGGEDENHQANGVRVKVIKDGKACYEELDPRELARLYAQQQAALRSVQGEFDFITVPDWVRLHPLLGSYVAEAFGTFSFVLTLSLVSVRNQSIFDTADDTNMTSLPIGFMLMCMVFTFGYISGGHFNPAITLSVFLIGKLDSARTMGYLVCQMGASLGAGLVSMAIQGSNDIFVPSVDTGYVSSGIFSELIYTFAIAIVVLNVAYSRQKGNFFYGFAIGMTIAAGSASVGRISGGAFNPAAATGLQLALCLTGSCEPLKSFWVYWLAPLVGAALASLVYSQMYQPTGTQVLQDVNVFKEQNTPIVDQAQEVEMAATNVTVSS